MKTIVIKDGLIHINSNGSMELIEGLDKASQDVARHILTDYNAYFDTGSTLNSVEIGSAVSELAIERAISDAVYRLISIQAIRLFDDRIISVNQIKTARVDLSTIVFYVEVLHEGGPASFASKATSLQQLISEE